MSHLYGVVETETWILGDEKRDSHWAPRVTFDKRTRQVSLTKYESPPVPNALAQAFAGHEQAGRNITVLMTEAEALDLHALLGKLLRGEP